MSNSSDVDHEAMTRLIEEMSAAPRSGPTTGVLSPEPEPEPDSVEQPPPFAPVGDTSSTESSPERSLISVVTTCAWRRPVMLFLIVAVAGSVALAASRSTSFGTSDRVVDANADAGNGNSTADDVSAGEGGDGPARAMGDLDPNGTSESEPSDLSPVETSPLQVTVPGPVSTSSTVRSEAGRSAVEPTSTTASTASTSPSERVATSGTPTTSAERPTSEESTTIRRTTTTQTTGSEQTTTTRATTTRKQTTTTRVTTTTVRTSTTVVLISQSAGGFESPAIRDEMVWLDNGDVGRWRSTNGDIQLMRSGFEGIESVDGGQFAELNSSSQAGLYRSLTVEPGTVIEWTFLHRARTGRERIEIRIGPSSDPETVDTVEASAKWRNQAGQWRVPDGVNTVRFMLWSTEAGYYGNLVDAVRVSTIDG